ncbi:MAG: hypothetical protein A2Y41_10830 [Spirochaetes bacterium GWB1_36_13]|nr:MAG: hypothetical protein A2Y41_10830 [Spirochaetes bacterium GWB1_36_13]
MKELSFYEDWFKIYDFNTLYIGGGTPSLFSLKGLETLFKNFNQYKIISSFDEITLEVNPESVSDEKMDFYRSLGINRISIGIQSFDSKILKMLGRLADREKNLKAVETVQKYFKNFSIDLIYGIPGQDLNQELEMIENTASPHFSAYCLTLAPDTPLYREKSKYQQDDNLLNQLFETIHNFSESKGFSHYEISNYGFPGFESAHNLHYWKRNPYLGLGAGASGFLDDFRYKNQNLENYQNSLNQKKIPILEKEKLDLKDVFIERFMLGLRMKEGLPVFSSDFESGKGKVIQDWIEKKRVKKKETKLLPTLKGWEVLDYMTQSLYNEIEKEDLTPKKG